jgi:SAM-dependent methyltransferase
MGRSVYAVVVLAERTVEGLHDFVAETLARYAPIPGTAIDLGAGSGAFASRLAALGWDVTCVERNTEGFLAPLPVIAHDLDAGPLDVGTFDLVTAIEVIEHVESPAGFLRQVSGLLAPGGVAIVTTPNVDSVNARLKGIATGRLRMFDDAGDPEHISPIFYSLFLDRLIPRAGLRLTARYPYPPHGSLLTRRWLARVAAVLARFVPGPANQGDNHVFVLRQVG